MIFTSVILRVRELPIWTNLNTVDGSISVGVTVTWPSSLGGFGRGSSGGAGTVVVVDVEDTTGGLGGRSGDVGTGGRSGGGGRLGGGGGGGSESGGRGGSIRVSVVVVRVLGHSSDTSVTTSSDL